MPDQKRILIVEDDQLTRELYQDVFKMAGFEVDTANDGDSGVTKIQSGGWSVILLDIMMPKKDGLQVLKEIKDKPPQSANGPIIVLTNLSQDPIVKEAMQLGAKTYLLKSELNPDQLVSQVTSHL